MTDIAALIERLRKAATEPCDGCCYGDAMAEAAEALSRLSASPLPDDVTEKAKAIVREYAYEVGCLEALRLSIAKALAEERSRSASPPPDDCVELLRLADDLEAGELHDLDAQQTDIVVRALRGAARASPLPDDSDGCGAEDCELCDGLEKHIADLEKRLTSPLPDEIAGLLALGEDLPEEPWRAGAWNVYDAHGLQIAGCFAGDEGEPVARAIAALPRLFAALERLAREFGKIAYFMEPHAKLNADQIIEMIGQLNKERDELESERDNANEALRFAERLVTSLRAAEGHQAMTTARDVIAKWFRHNDLCPDQDEKLWADDLLSALLSAPKAVLELAEQVTGGALKTYAEFKEEARREGREGIRTSPMPVSEEEVEAAREANYGLEWLNSPQWLKELRRSRMRAALEAAAKVRESKAKKTLNEALDFFAADDTNPGNDWTFTDDGAELCLDYLSSDGARFWLDLKRNGTIDLLWRPPGSQEAQSFTFAVLAGKTRAE